MFFFFNSDQSDIERMIGERVEKLSLRSKWCSSFGDVAITYYDALTETGIYDLAISNDETCCTVFHKYDRKTFPAKHLKQILEAENVHANVILRENWRYAN